MLLFKDREHKNESYSYNDLFNYLNSGAPVVSNFKEKEVGLFLLNLLKAICNNIDVLLLDLDFTDEEILAITHETYEKKIVYQKFVQVINTSALNFSIQQSKSQISILTSGTTGQPKIVQHSVQNLIREVRIAEKFKKSCWGLAYNPTHMAGLQVIFQALLNGNSLINLFEASKAEVYHSIQQNSITHISATPTFFRLLLPFEQKFLGVQNISMGGEKSSESLLEKVQAIFPNAKINNIYASTEAGTLFAAHGTGFKVPTSKKEYIKIEADEIFVHRSLLGNANELNQLNWYATGDIVEWVNQEEGVFKIISRKNELLNIGGNKVNPADIEQYLEQIDGVESAYVYGRSNSVLGTILCCDIYCTKSITELELKQYLQNKLQPFKIPRKFYFKTSLEFTRNGKIKRAKND